jgi:hypothetical protein
VSTRRAFAAIALGFVFLLTTVRSSGQEVDAAILVGTVLDTGQAAARRVCLRRCIPRTS